MIVGLDLGTSRTGWCSGLGDCVPQAGAILLPPIEGDYGAHLRCFEQGIRKVWALGEPTTVLYEAPIILRRDLQNLAWVRGIYGMGCWLEWWCAAHGVPCYEAGLHRIKRELAGKSGAGKDDMVLAAERVGVRLPASKAKGREDAADAFGAWLLGVRFYAKEHAPAWDRRLWSSRGAML